MVPASAGNDIVRGTRTRTTDCVRRDEVMFPMSRGLDLIVHAVSDPRWGAGVLSPARLHGRGTQPDPWGTHNHIVSCPIYLELLTGRRTREVGGEGIPRCSPLHQSFLERGGALFLLWKAMTPEADAADFAAAGSRSRRLAVRARGSAPDAAG